MEPNWKGKTLTRTVRLQPGHDQKQRHKKWQSSDSLKWMLEFHTWFREILLGALFNRCLSLHSTGYGNFKFWDHSESLWYHLCFAANVWWIQCKQTRKTTALKVVMITRLGYHFVFPKVTHLILKQPSAVFLFLISWESFWLLVPKQGTVVPYA